MPQIHEELVGGAARGLDQFSVSGANIDENDTCAAKPPPNPRQACPALGLRRPA
jgi:hypothetical protein